MKHGLFFRSGSLILIGVCFGQSMVNASFHGVPILGLPGNSPSMESPAGLAPVPSSNAGLNGQSLADAQIAHFFGHIKDGSLRRVKELARNNVAYVNVLDELGATALYRTVEHYCDAIISEKKKYVSIFKYLLAQGADSAKGFGSTSTEALIVWRNNRLSGDPYKGRCGELKKILDDYKSGRLVVSENESEEDDFVLDEVTGGRVEMHADVVHVDRVVAHYDDEDPDLEAGIAANDNGIFDLGGDQGADDADGVLAGTDLMGAVLNGDDGDLAGDLGIEDADLADEGADNRPVIVELNNAVAPQANSNHGIPTVSAGNANAHANNGLAQGVQGSVQTAGLQASSLPWTQLNKALKKQNTTELERLTREYKELLTDRDPQGNTALHLALQLAQKNRAAGIQGFDFLVKKGAVYNVADASHKTVKDLLPSSAVPVTLLNEASQLASPIKPEKSPFFTRRNVAVMTGIGVLSGLILSYFLKENSSGYGALFPRSLPGNSSGAGIDI